MKNHKFLIFSNFLSSFAKEARQLSKARREVPDLSQKPVDPLETKRQEIESRLASEKKPVIDTAREHTQEASGELDQTVTRMSTILIDKYIKGEISINDILDEKEILIFPRAPKEKVPLASFTPEDIENLTKQILSKDSQNLGKLLDKINVDGPLNAYHLLPATMQILIEQFKDQEPLIKKLIQVILVSPTRTSQLIEFMPAALFDELIEKNLLSKDDLQKLVINYPACFSAATLSVLYIKKIIDRKILEKILDSLNLQTKIGLLSQDNRKFIKTLGTEEWKNYQTLILQNILKPANLKRLTADEINLLLENSSLFEESPSKLLLPILDNIDESKIAQLNTKSVLDLLTFYIKNPGIKSTRSLEQFITALTPAQKVECTKSSESNDVAKELFKYLDPDQRLLAAGFNIQGKNIVFEIPKGIQRDFNKTKAIELMKGIQAENADIQIRTLLDRVRLSVYQRLLDIIVADKSINDNHWSIKDFRKSNAQLAYEIAQLEIRLDKKLGQDQELSESQLRQARLSANNKLSVAVLGEGDHVGKSGITFNVAKDGTVTIKTTPESQKVQDTLKALYKDMRAIWLKDKAKTDPFDEPTFLEANKVITTITPGTVINMPFVSDTNVISPERQFEESEAKESLAETKFGYQKINFTPEEVETMARDLRYTAPDKRAALENGLSKIYVDFDGELYGETGDKYALESAIPAEKIKTKIGKVSYEKAVGLLKAKMEQEDRIIVKDPLHKENDYILTKANFSTDFPKYLEGKRLTVNSQGIIFSLEGIPLPEEVQSALFGPLGGGDLLTTASEAQAKRLEAGIDQARLPEIVEILESIAKESLASKRGEFITIVRSPFQYEIAFDGLPEGNHIMIEFNEKSSRQNPEYRIYRKDEKTPEKYEKWDKAKVTAKLKALLDSTPNNNELKEAELAKAIAELQTAGAEITGEVSSLTVDQFKEIKKYSEDLRESFDRATNAYIISDRLAQLNEILTPLLNTETTKGIKINFIVSENKTPHSFEWTLANGFGTEAELVTKILEIKKANIVFQAQTQTEAHSRTERGQIQADRTEQESPAKLKELTTKTFDLDPSFDRHNLYENDIKQNWQKIDNYKAVDRVFQAPPFNLQDSAQVAPIAAALISKDSNSTISFSDFFSKMVSTNGDSYFFKKFPQIWNGFLDSNQDQNEKLLKDEDAFLTKFNELKSKSNPSPAEQAQLRKIRVILYACFDLMEAIKTLKYYKEYEDERVDLLGTFRSAETQDEQSTPLDGEYLGSKYEEEKYSDRTFALDSNFYFHNGQGVTEEVILKNWPLVTNHALVDAALQGSPFSVAAPETARVAAAIISQNDNDEIAFEDFFETTGGSTYLFELMPAVWNNTDIPKKYLKDKKAFTSRLQDLKAKSERSPAEEKEFQAMSILQEACFKLMDLMQTLRYRNEYDAKESETTIEQPQTAQAAILSGTRALFGDAHALGGWDSFTSCLSDSNRNPDSLTMVDVDGTTSVMTRDQFTMYYNGESALIKLLNEKGICDPSYHKMIGGKRVEVRPINREKLGEKIKYLITLGWRNSLLGQVLADKEISKITDIEAQKLAINKKFEELERKNPNPAGKLPPIPSNLDDIARYFTLLTRDPKTQEFFQTGFMLDQVKQGQTQMIEAIRGIQEEYQAGLEAGTESREFPASLQPYLDQMTAQFKAAGELNDQQIEEKVKQAGRALLGTAYIEFTDGKFTGAGASVPFNLGDGYTLSFGLGGSANAPYTGGVVAGVGLSIQVWKAGSMVVNVTPAVSTQGAGLGVGMGGEIADGISLSGNLFVGLSWNGGAIPGATISLSWGNRVQRKQFEEREQDEKKDTPLAEVWDQLSSTSTLTDVEKMEMIKSCKTLDLVFQNIKEKFPDFFTDPALGEADSYAIFFKILSIYKEQKMTAIYDKYTGYDAVPGLTIGIALIIAGALTGGTALVAIGCIGGIQVKINQVEVFFPRRSEKLRALHQLANTSLALKAEAWFAGIEAGEKSAIAESFTSTELYYRPGSKETGYVLPGSTTSQISNEYGNIDQYNDELDGAKVRLNPVKEGVFEFIVEESGEKMTDLYIDPTIKDSLRLTLDPKSGKLYIAGKITDLVITRKSVQFNRPLGPGMSNIMDVIYIRQKGSVQGDINEQWLEQHSNKMLTRRPGHQWQAVGLTKRAHDTIQEVPDYLSADLTPVAGEAPAQAEFKRQEAALRSLGTGLDTGFERATQHEDMLAAMRGTETIIQDPELRKQVVRVLASLSKNPQFKAEIGAISLSEGDDVHTKLWPTIEKYWRKAKASKSFLEDGITKFPNLPTEKAIQENIAKMAMKEYGLGTFAQIESPEFTMVHKTALDKLYTLKYKEGKKTMLFKTALDSNIDNPPEILKLIESVWPKLKEQFPATPDLPVNPEARAMLLTAFQNYLTNKHFTNIYNDSIGDRPERSEMLSETELQALSLKPGSFIVKQEDYPKGKASKFTIYTTNYFDLLIYDKTARKFHKFDAEKKPWEMSMSDATLKAPFARAKQLLLKQKQEVITANKEVVRRLKSRIEFERGEFTKEFKAVVTRINAQGIKPAITTKPEELVDTYMKDIYGDLVAKLSTDRNPPFDFRSLSLTSIPKDAFFVSGTYDNKRQAELTTMINKTAETNPPELPYGHGFLQSSVKSYDLKALYNNGDIKDKPRYDLARVLLEFANGITIKDSKETNASYYERLLREPFAGKFLISQACLHLTSKEDYAKLIKIRKALTLNQDITKIEGISAADLDTVMEKFITLVKEVRECQVQGRLFERDSTDGTHVVKIYFWDTAKGAGTTITAGAYSKCGNPSFFVTEIGKVIIYKKDHIHGSTVRIMDESIFGQGVENHDFSVVAAVVTRKDSSQRNNKHSEDGADAEEDTPPTEEEKPKPPLILKRPPLKFIPPVKFRPDLKHFDTTKGLPGNSDTLPPGGTAQGGGDGSGNTGTQYTGGEDNP